MSISQGTATALRDIYCCWFELQVFIRTQHCTRTFRYDTHTRLVTDPSVEAEAYVGVPPLPGKPDTNVIEGPSPVIVHDARSREGEFSLDKSGFQFVKHVSTEREFTDDERIKNVYYKKVEELLKNVTGAPRR